MPTDISKRVPSWLSIVVGLFLTGAVWCFFKAGEWAILTWRATR